MANPASGSIPAPSELEAWRQLACRVLDAASEHAVKCGEAEADTFRQRVQESLRSLANNPTASQVLVMAGALAQTIAHYNDQTQRRIDALLEELRSPSTEQSSTAKPQIVLDPCTGLPDRAAAEEAIRLALAGKGPGYVAVFYLHRLAWINAHFGEAIGNQVIRFSSEHLASAVIQSGDSLYRWRGPAFVALLERAESPLQVNHDVQRAISTSLSRFFETPTRTVYLPLKLTADVIVTVSLSYEEIAEQIERFILTAS